jgi:internalin A
METRNTPTYQMINNRIQNKDSKGVGIVYGYNNELQSPFIQYLNTSDSTHNVLIYENGKSMCAKIDLVKKYGLGGISLWSLSNIPDYNDKTAKVYGMDVWNSILNSIKVSSDIKKETAFTFKDKIVENAVRKQLIKPTGAIYKSDLEKVYRLAVPVGVKTLIDIKQMANLEYLDLSNTKTTDVSTLGSLKNLRVLYLQRNNISNISVLKGLSKLEVLSVNGNKLSNISALSGLTQLSELYIRDNKITNYNPISNLKKLRILYLKGNVSPNYASLKTVKKSLLEYDF